MKRKRITLSFLLIFINVFLFSQLRFLSREQKIDNSNFEAYFPEIKIDSGKAYLLYQLKKPDGVYIMFTKSNDLKNWTIPYEINTGYPVSHYSDDVAFSWDVYKNKIVISWIYTFDVYNCPYYTTYGVPRAFFRFSNDSGENWNSIHYIDDVKSLDDTHDDYGVRVVLGENNLFFMRHIVYSWEDILEKRFSKISYEGKILKNIEKFIKNMSLSPRTDLMFSLHSKKSDKAYYTLTEGYGNSYVVSYNGDNVSTVVELVEDDYSYRFQRIRDLKMNKNKGNIYVIWEDMNYMSDKDAVIKLKIIYPNGSVSNTVTVSRDRESRKFGSTIDSSGDKVAVVWSDGRNGNDYENFDVYLNYSNDGGLSFNKDIKINKTEGGTVDAMFPTVAVDGNRIYVAWTDYRNGKPNIYMNYSLDGGKNWLSEDIHITSLPLGKYREYYPVLYANNGKLYIFWFDEREGGFHIYERIAHIESSKAENNSYLDSYSSPLEK